MFRYISVIIILTVLGVLYEKYKLKFMPDEELRKYDLIKKYLLNGDEDLGQNIIMKGDKFHYNQGLGQFATGMNGDEDLG